jgi:hypothetical protein
LAPRDLRGGVPGNRERGRVTDNCVGVTTLARGGAKSFPCHDAHPNALAPESASARKALHRDALYDTRADGMGRIIINRYLFAT